ncbi:MAG: hypothetical protein PHW95_05190 [Patescibacteria group bacterium]|nr:hypothetical protein [Patescibacteria group bacterium]
MFQSQIKKIGYYVGSFSWLAAAAVTLFSIGNLLNRQCTFLQSWPFCSPGDNTQSVFQGGFVLLIIGLLTMSGYYFFNLLQTETLVSTRLLVVITGVSLLGTLLLLPFTSADLQYFYSAGKAVAAGINPYTTNWPMDIPFFNGQAKFAQGIMYGPLSVDLFAFIVKITRSSLLAFMAVWKILLLAVFGLVGYLVQKKSTLPKANYWFFWLLQPLFLWEWIGNGHFDGIWVALLLLAMFAAEKSKWWLVGLSLTLGIWIKFIPALTLPWFALWWWQGLNRENWIKRAVELLLTVGASGLATLWFWQPYWIGLETLKPIVVQSKWAVSSLFSAAYYSLSPTMQGWFGEMSHYYLTRLVHGLLFIILIYLVYPYIKAALKILFKQQTMPTLWYYNAIFVTLLAYLLVWQKSFWPWYPLWLIPLGLMIFFQAKNQYLKKIILSLSLMPLIFYVPWMTYNGDLSALWFYWFVVIAIIAYPLWQLFIWRRKNFELV